MTKPREFYLIMGAYLTISGVPIENNPEQIHVREVVPIDWEKVWLEHDKWFESLISSPEENDERILIQQLVDRQLKGEN